MLEEEFVGMAEVGGKTPEEAQKEEAKVEIKPYKVFGQDFSLSDPDFIDYYKTRMKMMAIKYRLCGRVNDQGQYKIPDAIRFDLVKMEKEIEETGEDFYKAIALYMKKHFYFHVKIVQIEDGKAKASLFLSEYVEDFLGLDSIVSHVADFVDNYDDDFRIRVRKAFNLVDVATKVDDFAVPNIAVVMQDAMDLELVVGGLYDMASQIFVMRLLKALEESGEGGAQVLAKYRELLADNEIELNEKFRYSSYKALLDRAVDECGGYEKLKIDPNITKSIIKEINGTVKAIDNASGKGGYVEPVMPQKLEEKKSAGTKSKGGTKKNAPSTSTKTKAGSNKTTKKQEKTPATNKSGGVPTSSYDVKEVKVKSQKSFEKEETESAPFENDKTSTDDALPPSEIQDQHDDKQLNEDDFNMSVNSISDNKSSVIIETTKTISQTQVILPNGNTGIITETVETVKIETITKDNDEDEFSL